MAERGRPLISLIVPTRGRVEKLRQFVDSLAATTAQPDRVEVILVADEDDAPTLAFRHPGLPIKMIAGSPGRTMGALNRDGYAASAGDFVMLLNDDVIARTQAWDDRVLELLQSFPDGIVLVHVNDTVFEDKLCIFPFLSRTYCEIAGNICPADYARYRIDDHIYNVFNLLAVLGRQRIVYLPDIVFEHTNAGAGTGTDRYVPIPEIHAADTRHFDRLLADRKKLAIKLAASIDRHLSSELADTRKKLLAPIADSASLRKPEFVTVRREGRTLSSANTRVTIGVVSADTRNPHAKTCIEAIKQHTANYELIVFDNNFGPDFNHPREMNRILAVCRTDFLVLMDDDVFVNSGWLDNLLRCVTPQVGVVTPMHMDRNGELTYAGIVMRADKSGNHAHSLLVPPAPAPVQTICSAIMLIDMAKCGHLRVDESYAKYFLDIDYGLRVWEAGYQAVVSPYSLVTHLGGATMQRREDGTVDQMFETQRAHFVREWMAGGRLRKLARNMWSSVPAIANARQSRAERTAREGRERSVPASAGIRHAPQAAGAGQLDSNFYPVLLETAGGHNIVQFIGRFWAVPQVLGDADLRREADRQRPGVIVADTLAEVRAAVDRAGVNSEIVLVQHGYKSHNIARYLGRYWGLPLALGRIDFADPSVWRRPGVIVADTLAEVRAAIDSAGAKYQMTLIAEAYKSHNIIRYLGRYWGLPQAFGEVSLVDEAVRQRPGVIVADTFIEALIAIDRVYAYNEIVLVQEAYKAHNIVSYLGQYWGLPMALGRIDLTDEADRRRPGVIVADTLIEAQAAIDRADANNMVLVQEAYKAHNIVTYGGQYWGLPMALGRIELADEADRQRPGVLVAGSLAEVLAAIDAAQEACN